MHSGIHKLRYLLAARSELLARVCLAIALIGVLGAGFAFANPPTTEVPLSTDRQPIAMTLHSQATVEQASSLYSQGETLSDMPVYVRSYTPTVTLSLVTTPPEGQQIQIDQRLSLVYEARTSSGEVFWQQRQILQRTKTSTSGEKVVTNATLNISETSREITQLESEIGDAGQISVYLDVESQYSTLNASGSMNRHGTIHIREKSYEIEHMTGKNMVGTPEKTIQLDASKAARFTLPFVGVLIIPHTTLIFALLGLCGVIGFGVTVVFAERFDPEDEQMALHKARYSEWISEGTLPANLEDRTIVMETLEDLVDIAIDSEKRIVYDSSQGKYAVVDSQIVYLYVENPDQDFLWT